MDTVLNALRYKYHPGRSNSVARYRTGNLPNIFREWDYDTANAYWKNKILESWNADTWEYVDYPTDRPYYWVQNNASYYYGVDEDPEAIGGYMQVYSCSWGFVPRFVSRVYIFGKVDKINESDPPAHVSELKMTDFIRVCRRVWKKINGMKSLPRISGRRSMKEISSIPNIVA